MLELPKCAKCKSSMEPGFMLDMGYGRRYASRWVKGKPQSIGKSFFHNVFGNISVKGREIYNIQVLRCSHCGYLELTFRGSGTAVFDLISLLIR